MSIRVHKKKQPRNQAGFTLMEGIAVLGVMTMLLVMVGQIFLVSYDTYLKQSARANSDANAMLAVRAITEATRGALAVLPSHEINGTTYSSSPTELVLQLPAVNTSGELIENEYDYIAFYRDGAEPTKIFSDTEPAEASYRIAGQKKMTGHNQVLTLRYDNPVISEAKRVSIYLKNNQVIRNSTIKSEAWSSIFLRNR